MKLKSLIFGLGLSLCSFAFASNVHVHPESTTKDANSAAISPTYTTDCTIEIVNRSYEDVVVSGVYEDGYPLQSFTIYSFEQPHRILMGYDGYCHTGMYIYIRTVYGDYVYSGYTYTGQTIRIVPYLAKQVKAEVVTK